MDPRTDTRAPVFEAIGVGKAYPGVKALDDVSFAGYGGQVIAVCGANGAGKSTFSKLVAGLEKPTEGKILLNGAPLAHNLPKDGIDAGVLMMYQEPLIIQDLSVKENLWLFDMNRSAIGLTIRRGRAESQDLLSKVGLENVDLDRPAGELTPGHRHMLALARAFIVPHKLLILDETTASTNEEHFEIVVDIVKQHKAAGTCVIFVSHKLNEVQILADRIAVLRDGKLVDVVDAEGHSDADISAMMIGERLSALAPKETPYGGESDPIFEVKHFSCGRITDLSLSVRPGEVVGFYGLVGSGRSTFGKAIGGHFPFKCDSISIHGHPVSVRTPKAAIESGICYLTEDRHKEGFVPHFTNLENMSLVALSDYARRSVIQKRRERALGNELRTHFQIKGELDDFTTNLSGGNQQKICVSKWSASSADVIVFDEPTKGVDVGAKRQIYEIVKEFAANGKAIILISSEAEEIMHLSDRAVVMVEYEVAAELLAGQYDKTQLISIALGHELRERRNKGEIA